jgi:hypothetical protein
MRKVEIRHKAVFVHGEKCNPFEFWLENFRGTIDAISETVMQIRGK